MAFLDPGPFLLCRVYRRDGSGEFVRDVDSHEMCGKPNELDERCEAMIGPFRIDDLVFQDEVVF